jgi:hypothetical protein
VERPAAKLEGCGWPLRCHFVNSQALGVNGWLICGNRSEKGGRSRRRVIAGRSTRAGVLHGKKLGSDGLAAGRWAEPKAGHVVLFDDNGGTRCPNSSEMMALGSSQEV